MHPKFPESDHRPLSLAITCNVLDDPEIQSGHKSTWIDSFKYKYTRSDLELFPSALRSADSLSRLGDCLDAMSSLETSPDDMANAFSAYVSYAIEKIASK